MEYDNLFIEKINSYDNCKNYIIKKKNYTNINLINKLKSKINELENRLDFYNKYDNNIDFNNTINLDIINTINNIDNLLNSLNKNIINNGQLSGKNKYIEYEF